MIPGSGALISSLNETGKLTVAWGKNFDARRDISGGGIFLHFELYRSRLHLHISAD